MGIWQRVRRLFRRRADLLNLRIRPAYAIRASARNPYFQALEQRAREAGYLGEFIVDVEGCLRPGTKTALSTLEARLTLDVYPNPAALEGRTVPDFAATDGRRHAPRATVTLEDDSDLQLWRASDGLQVRGQAIDDAREAQEDRRRSR